MIDHSRPLSEDEAAPDPFVQFGRWFAEAAGSERVPEAVAVATVSADCRPSVRMVLMKSWDARGFVFHTNYGSRKGRDIAARPRVALLFHWDSLGRQVRVEGPAERISADESDTHFAGRPRGAQIGAHASYQSRPIAARHELDVTVADVAGRFAGRPVPRPPWWGGIRVRPEVFEFWQNRYDRLHDRLRYVPEVGDRPDGGSALAWRIERLQP
jgi:pyridoxamine 5'-phosphate oxidase